MHAQTQRFAALTQERDAEIQRIAKREKRITKLERRVKEGGVKTSASWEEVARLEKEIQVDQKKNDQLMKGVVENSMVRLQNARLSPISSDNPGPSSSHYSPYARQTKGISVRANEHTLLQAKASGTLLKKK